MQSHAIEHEFRDITGTFVDDTLTRTPVCGLLSQSSMRWYFFHHRMHADCFWTAIYDHHGSLVRREASAPRPHHHAADSRSQVIRRRRAPWPLMAAQGAGS